MPVLDDSFDIMHDHVVAMEEGGATALGPALVVSCAIASHVPRSEVRMITGGEGSRGNSVLFRSITP